MAKLKLGCIPVCHLAECFRDLSNTSLRSFSRMGLTSRPEEVRTAPIAKR